VGVRVDGALVGLGVGNGVGWRDGERVGSEVSFGDGKTVGRGEGWRDAEFNVGNPVGFCVGCMEGLGVGSCVGIQVLKEGVMVGSLVGM
jgi:hypothetical protein